MISIISLWYRHCKQSEQDWADAPTASENTGLQTSRVVLTCFEITGNLEEIRPRPNNDQNQPFRSIKWMSIHENPPKCIKTIGSQPQIDLTLSAPVPGWSGLFPERCLAIAPTWAICHEWKEWKKHGLSRTNAPKKRWKSDKRMPRPTLN